MGIYAAIWDIILAEFALFAALFCPVLAVWRLRRARAHRPGCSARRPIAVGIALGAALALCFTAFAELAVRPFWIRHHRRKQVASLVEVLESSEEVLDRRWAASMIWNHAMTGSGAGAAPALVRSLADPDPGVRSTACMALGELGKRDELGALDELGERGEVGRRKALAEITKLLTDDDERVRRSAAAALAHFERDDE